MNKLLTDISLEISDKAADLLVKLAELLTDEDRGNIILSIVLSNSFSLEIFIIQIWHTMKTLTQELLLFKYSPIFKSKLFSFLTNLLLSLEGNTVNISLCMKLLISVEIQILKSARVLFTILSKSAKLSHRNIL